MWKGRTLALQRKAEVSIPPITHKSLKRAKNKKSRYRHFLTKEV